MRAIRFLRPHTLYNVGEVAGFPEETCMKLIDAKIAEFVDQPEKVEQRPARVENADPVPVHSDPGAEHGDPAGARIPRRSARR